MTNVIIVAFTIWLECANQSFSGKAHAATVIHNTAVRYKLSPQACCLKRGWFSSWNADDPRSKDELMKSVVAEGQPWKDCLALAMEVCGTNFHPLSNANHFWKVGTHPYWEKYCVDVYRVEDHLFGFEPGYGE